MYLKEPIYLSGRGGRRTRRTGPARTLVNLAFVACAVGVNYYVFFNDADEPIVPALEQPKAATPSTEEAPPSATAPRAPAGPPSGAPVPGENAVTIVRAFTGKLAPGDTVFRAVEGQGIDHEKVSPVLAAMQSVFDFKRAQAGHQYSGELDGQGRITKFQYVTGPLEQFNVVLDGEGYVATRKQVPVDIQTVHVGCAIGTSLFASLTRCGETPDLAQRVSDLFAFDVDFFQEIRPGDVIKVIVEKEYIAGRFAKYGRIVAARYEGKFGRHEAFLYKDQASREAYYMADGEALEKEFLKTPLKYTRISSGFTTHRFHPTLHSWRKHLAVDYAAPINTPVQAVASGVVSFVGDQGPSGNLVTIAHSGGHESYYAHLNKFGAFKKGDIVTQRSVIGYVGQTGRATGPHLHFALKKGEEWVNPLETKSLTVNPLEDGEKDAFRAALAPLIEALDDMRVQALADREG